MRDASPKTKMVVAENEGRPSSQILLQNSDESKQEELNYDILFGNFPAEPREAILIDIGEPAHPRSPEVHDASSISIQSASNNVIGESMKNMPSMRPLSRLHESEQQWEELQPGDKE